MTFWAKNVKSKKINFLKKSSKRTTINLKKNKNKRIECAKHTYYVVFVLFCFLSCHEILKITVTRWYYDWMRDFSSYEVQIAKAKIKNMEVSIFKNGYYQPFVCFHCNRCFDKMIEWLFNNLRNRLFIIIAFINWKFAQKSTITETISQKQCNKIYVIL